MKRVKKRDGRFQTLDINKIKKALLAAFHEVGADTGSVGMIVSGVESQIADGDGVEDVQNIVLRVLKSYNAAVHDTYRDYRTKRGKIRLERLHPDNSLISGYTTLAKYMRHVNGRRETWEEAVDRYLECVGVHSGTIRDMMYSRKVLGSMRGLQFAGPAVESNHCRLYNCAFSHMNRWRAFGELFWILLSGCGTGASVQRHHVSQLAPLSRIRKKEVAHISIADTIEGWGDALTELVKGYVRGYHVEFDYSDIRPEGAPLRTTGGLAPGHLPLKGVLENVRQVLDRAQGRQIRPIEAADIICHSAMGVLAGGIRRSSVILLFGLNDTEMLYYKAHGNFVPYEANDQRKMANISVVLHRDHMERKDLETVLRVSREWGEPGVFFTTDYDYGTNPCGEIGLNPRFKYEEIPDTTLDFRVGDHNYGSAVGWQFCNLCEINGTAVTRENCNELAWAAAVLGTHQATFTEFPYLGPVTEAVVRRDALLGVSMTGMLDNPLCLEPSIQRAMAQTIKDTNLNLAPTLGILPAARCTTVKPSGTASLILGAVGSGIHPHHARRYFRRITAKPNEPVAQFLASVNPHMITTKPDGDWAITFCIEAPSDAITLKELSAVDHLELITRTYANWIYPGTRSGDLTHNVSCTIVFKNEQDYEEAVEYIWDQRDSLAAVTLFPDFADKAFPFAPREAVSTEMDERIWNDMIALTRPVNWSAYRETVDGTLFTPECTGQSCAME